MLTWNIVAVMLVASNAATMLNINQHAAIRLVLRQLLKINILFAAIRLIFHQSSHEAHYLHHFRLMQPAGLLPDTLYVPRVRNTIVYARVVRP